MQSIPRALLITALVGVLVACLGSWLALGTATRRAASYGMATRALDELSLLAGLSDDDGQLLRDEPMAVELIADGGPMWVLDSVERAVATSDHFAIGASRHLLRSEVIDVPQGIALQLHLWRNGWELREPQPRRIRIAPWVAILAGVFGGAAALLVQRVSVGLATAGLLAQLMMAIDRPPSELFASQSLAEAWASGPLLAQLGALLQGLDVVAIAIVLAMLAGSLVLVAFDHRRTRGSEDDLGLAQAALAAVLGFGGVLAWLEAASRGSLFAACDLRFGAWAGLLALAGLIVAWLPAIRVGREAWRGRAS